jgi:hypothetical protein
MLSKESKSASEAPARVVETALSGYELLNDPLLNKGTAFTEAEREEFELHGLFAGLAAICRNTLFSAGCRIPTRRCSTRC